MTVTLETLERFPAVNNPYLHDLYNMGTNFGRLELMYDRTKDPRYLILVDKTTGERIRVKIDY